MCTLTLDLDSHYKCREQFQYLKSLLCVAWDDKLGEFIKEFGL